eukprot:CAMPEP_0204607582 /NCGR_PEP_ID=MMETSP0661-20131031/59800_1 /ASSEMBLY_ACC=CAM_ASM_000606 /TAXON_ID=109239 /ORGANISM="Alexandrium margalefi, Strain AMGDE01CS-322" /LENGTH=542 /DNA_ID=CAMNT_0051619005 /DNA_START=29 /DNA_END=1657 /DNA_ORIENTATION=+
MAALLLWLVAAALAAPVDGGGSSAAPATGEAKDAEVNRRFQELERGMSALREELNQLRQARKPGSAAGGSPTQFAEESKPKFVDKLKQFFDGCKNAARRVLKPILLSDTMFYLSMLMVLQWHVRFHFGDWIHRKFFDGSMTKRQVKPMMTLRKIGINIMILGIYYDDTLMDWVSAVVKNRAFISSIGLVFIDSVVLYYGFQLLAICTVGGFGSKSISGQGGLEDWISPLGDDDDGICADKAAANNVYEDLTGRFRRVTPVWIVQIMLVAFYIEELNSNQDTKNIENVDFIYWVVAVLFQMHGGDDQVGEGFNFKYWNYVLPLTSGKEMMEKAIASVEQEAAAGSPEHAVPLVPAEARSPDANRKIWLHKKFLELGDYWHKVFWVVPMKLQYEWFIRMFMDFSVNSVSRSIILYTVPIMVSVEGPLDFVKDLTAVMFITMLDNIDGDPKDLDEVSVKIKFMLYYESTQWSGIHNLKRKICCIPCCDKATKDSVCKIPLTRVEREYINDAGTGDNFKRLRECAQEQWERFIEEEEPCNEVSQKA